MAYYIDRAHCSCCHRCRVECPSNAIRFLGSKYWIDPDKCIDCGHCVEVCHNGVISNPDIPKTEVIKHDRQLLNCDVLVIGGGAAGLIAAARVAEAGKQVIVIEKNHEIGGSAWYAHNIKVQWSDWHKAAGIPDPREHLYQDFMEKTEGKINGALLKNLLDADVDFINWLIRSHELGKDFTLGDGPFGTKSLEGTFDVPYNHKRIDTTIGPGGNGWFFCMKLLSIVETNGGTVLLNTAGKKLLQNEAGDVIGALAEDAGGILEIHASATIITAGTYTHNKELMTKFQPIFYRDDTVEPVHIFTCATCTGDGITMCDEIGADIDYENRRVNMFGPGRHPFGACGLKADASPSVMRIDPRGNLSPISFSMDEVSPLATEVPERFLWAVLDQRALEESMENAKGQRPDAVGVDMDRFYDNYQFEIDQEVSWGSIRKGETLEELADALGVDRDIFLASVATHNAHLHDPKPGGMPMFGATIPAEPIVNGPFYALKIKLFHENAIGGMVTDDKVRVLKQGVPIAGLYAAGDNIRGIILPGIIGVLYIENVLSALTVAFCSGFLAGNQALSYIEKKDK